MPLLCSYSFIIIKSLVFFLVKRAGTVGNALFLFAGSVMSLFRLPRQARVCAATKAPLGLSLLCSAAQTRTFENTPLSAACKKTQGKLWQKERGPDCWVSVKQFSKNDTATACQDWLRSTRLGRGSIKSHVRTVKVLGMGLFAFQERIHLWKGVTH